MATELPLRWLEADYADEQDENGVVTVRCHPLTICDALNSDVAEVFSNESCVGPKVTHEEAVAYVHLFVAAPKMRAALEQIAISTGDDECRKIAMAAIAQAEGR